MMAQLIDRKQMKADMKQLLLGAQVSPRSMTALYMLLLLVMNLADSATALSLTDSSASMISTFVSILVTLMSTVLYAGFVQYCMAIRRSERAEYLTLFDGFSLAGKLVVLEIVITVFVGLWSMLFVVPGIVAAYRYRFALYNLVENPALGVMEALNLSKQQTRGYKAQLFMLDMSYIGWTFLATLPSTVFGMYMTYQTASSMFGINGPALAFGLHPLVQILLSGLWDLLISLFYLPVYACAELGYFEIAKSTSGSGAHSRIPDGGPDNLGGL